MMGRYVQASTATAVFLLMLLPTTAAAGGKKFLPASIAPGVADALKSSSRTVLQGFSAMKETGRDRREEDCTPVTLGISQEAANNFLSSCQTFMDSFDSGLSDVEALCSSPCILPLLQLGDLASSRASQCPSLAAAFSVFANLIPDVVCPVNEQGLRCFTVAANFSTFTYDMEYNITSACGAINSLGCCYQSIFDAIQDPQYSSVFTGNYPVPTQSEKDGFKAACDAAGSSTSSMFSSACSAATVENGGIAASSLSLTSGAALSHTSLFIVAATTVVGIVALA